MGLCVVMERNKIVVCNYMGQSQKLYAKTQQLNGKRLTQRLYTVGVHAHELKKGRAT